MRLTRSWPALPFWLLLAVLFTWPVAREFSRALPWLVGDVDPLLQIFILGWDWKALLHDPGGVFNAPIFHPHPRTLTYMDHLIGLAALSLPLRLLGVPPPAVYNALVLLSFIGAAWGLYRLARGLGAGRTAAFLAGTLYAVAPYRLCNLSNLNQLQTGLVPLGLWFAFRFVATRRARPLLGLFGVVALQSWFGWYYTFHLMLAGGALIVGALATRRVALADLLGPTRLAGAGLAAAAILPGVWPYWQQQAAMPAFRRTLGMTALWSADLFDYARVNPGALPARLGLWPAGEQGYWPGFVLVLLALAGWAALGVRRRWERAALAAIGLGAFVLSLGPYLRAGGREFFIPLPYAGLYFIFPGFSSMRAPNRFAELVLLAVAVLAAFGAERWCRGRRFAAPALLAAGLALAWTGAVSLVPHPGAGVLPPTYAWLAARPGQDPILELPTPSRVTEESVRHATRQLYQLEHGKPRLDGVSGFVPPDIEVFRMTTQGFPRPGVVRAIARRGARWVVVHLADYPPERRAALESELAEAVARPEAGLIEVARFGDDRIYELRGVPPPRGAS